MCAHSSKKEHTNTQPQQSHNSPQEFGNAVWFSWLWFEVPLVLQNILNGFRQALFKRIQSQARPCHFVIVVVVVIVVIVVFLGSSRIRQMVVSRWNVRFLLSCSWSVSSRRNGTSGGFEWPNALLRRPFRTTPSILYIGKGSNLVDMQQQQQ